MKKLTPEDISMKSPGIQAKGAIKEKYDSVENFAKVIDMGIATVYQYLKRTDLGSAKFKLRLIKAFNTGFDDLILNKERQIKRFVYTIMHNYPKYNTETDLITIKKIMELCKKENMEAEVITMERNRAMYYFNDSRPKQAIEMLEEIINKAYKRKFRYHWLYFNSDLAVIYSYISNHTKAKEIYESFYGYNIEETKDMDFKDRALYKYYYSYGVLCNRIGQYDKAKSLFEESLKYAIDDLYKGGAIVGIGLSYKKKGEYDIALDYYFKALKIQPSIERKIKIYNNIAEVYKQKEEYDTAMEYILKAKHRIEWSGISANYVSYVTYLEIRFLKGHEELALKQLMIWAARNNKKRVPKAYIIFALKSMINLAQKSKSYMYLGELEDLIIDIMDKSEEKAYIEKLEQCLGIISKFFIKENRRRRVTVEKEDIK